MKYVVVLLCCFMFSCGMQQPTETSVMSFNIRYGTANDGDNSWEFRKDMLVNLIKKYNADVVGMQESLAFQIDEIVTQLPQYASVGVGRDDGIRAGEFSNILYNQERLQVLDSGTFWLSDTPEVPGSITWGNACTRVCTWAKLQTKDTNKIFFHFNLHLDHVSQPSREKSVQLVVEKMTSLAKQQPCVLTGDFNAGEDNPAITWLKENTKLQDSYRVLHADELVVGTFNGFAGTADGDKIDYIFAAPEFNVVQAKIIRDQKDEKYPSDHFPVLAVFSW